MKTKQKIQILVLSMSIGLSSWCFAGGMEGGGGKGVVCRDAHDNIQSVELLDLWEARTLFSEKLDPSIPALGLAAGVESMVLKLENSYPFLDSLSQGPELVCEKQACVGFIMRPNARLFLQPSDNVIRLHGVKLELTDDSNEIARPSGNCQVEQIVNYTTNNGKIYIDQDLYDRLDLSNQVALIAHESYYAFLREFAQEKSSIRVRRAIGFAMSVQTFSLTVPTIPKEHIVCTTGEAYRPNTKIDIYASADHKDFVIYPEIFGGGSLIGLKNPFFDTVSEVYDSISSGHCKLPDGHVINSMGMLDGPVEFDQEFNFIMACKNGVTGVFVNEHKTGSDAATTPLQCKLIQQ